MQMSENDELDPDTWDLDDWIDGVTRPTETVRLYRKGHLNDRLKDLERRIDLARRVPAEERGITDDSPESLMDEWQLVAQELSDSALPVRVQALTEPEIDAAKKAAKRDHKDDDTAWAVYVAAAGTVQPRFSPTQLMKVRQRAGDAQIGEMFATIVRLSRESVRPTVPSLPGSSRGSRA